MVLLRVGWGKSPIRPKGEGLTQETPTIVGRIPEKSGKTPKTSTVGRVCSDPGCETKLTRYNTSDYCYRHKPARFPRVRGRLR